MAKMAEMLQISWMCGKNVKKWENVGKDEKVWRG